MSDLTAARDETPRCGLCGEPMPPGEEMFQYHGHSGPCPRVPVLAMKGPLDFWAAREKAFADGSYDSSSPYRGDFHGAYHLDLQAQARALLLAAKAEGKREAYAALLAPDELSGVANKFKEWVSRRYDTEDCTCADDDPNGGCWFHQSAEAQLASRIESFEEFVSGLADGNGS